jgi:hypothetical protein
MFLGVRCHAVPNLRELLTSDNVGDFSLPALTPREKVREGSKNRAQIDLARGDAVLRRRRETVTTTGGFTLRTRMLSFLVLAGET